MKQSRYHRKFSFKGEKGTILAWVAGMMVVIFGVGALVVDVGMIQHEVAKMQRATDAAALDGAKQLPNEALSLARARYTAKRNGYDDDDPVISVTGTRNPDGQHPGYYQVAITNNVDFFFAPLLGYDNGNITISATASYTSPLPLYISGSSNQYGINGIMNLSCFGRYGRYTYGDCNSPQWLDNGDDNPYYNDEGYNFMLKVGADYFAKNGTNLIEVQIFDPDCYNVGNALDAGAGKVDEIRDAPGAPHPQPASKYTTTKYQLFAPDSTPTDYSDDVLIAEATWTPSMKTSDMKWTTPTGWAFNTTTYGIGNYRINVEAIDGSSENGFNLRAGAPDKVSPTGTWVPDNGTEVTAVGTLPINFNTSGTVNIDLGYIPPEAAGSNVYVNKFDTDVGAKSVTYYDEYGHSWPGQLAGNGTFKIDTLTIPDGYGGGRLFAEYVAGLQDTSVWQLYFDGYYDDVPGDLRLVD